MEPCAPAVAGVNLKPIPVPTRQGPAAEMGRDGGRSGCAKRSTRESHNPRRQRSARLATKNRVFIRRNPLRRLEGNGILWGIGSGSGIGEGL